jgi:hypothetical protein
VCFEAIRVSLPAFSRRLIQWRSESGLQSPMSCWYGTRPQRRRVLSISQVASSISVHSCT